MSGGATADETAVSVCRRVLARNVGVRPGEKLLVVTDPDREEFGRAFFQAAGLLGLDPCLIVMRTRATDGGEPPPLVEAAMLAADVIVSVPRYTMTHGMATREALRRGARLLSLPDLSRELLFSDAFATDPAEIAWRTERLCEAFTRGRHLVVRAPAGTCLEMDLGGWKRAGDVDDGTATGPGVTANLPAGEALISPLEGTARGTVVVDCSISGGIGLVQGVELTVEGGRVVRVRAGKPGAQEAVGRLVELLERYENADNLAEFALGTNPRARIMGHMLMDEKTLGTAHVAIGNSTCLGGEVYSPVHVDMVFSRVTVTVDGVTLVRDGEIQDQNLELVPPARWDHGPVAGQRAVFTGEPWVVREGLAYKVWVDVSRRRRETPVQRGAVGALAARILQEVRGPSWPVSDVVARWGEEALAALAELERALLVRVESTREREPEDTTEEGRKCWYGAGH